MTTFEILLLAHVVGDWLLQTEWQALNKAHSWRAMGAHVLTYHAVLLAALVLRFGAGNPYVYAVTVVLALTHAVIDRPPTVLRVMRVLRITRERPPERWLAIVVDQCIHVVLLAAAAMWLGRVISN
jgi:hypothetical protein